MTRAIRSCIAAALLLAAGGACTATLIDDAYVMQHPLRGGVAQNHLTSRDYMDERNFGLSPGSLTSEGSLISLDDKEVCFQVTLRTVGQRQDLASPQGWKVFLRGLPEFEDMAPIHKSTVPPQQAVMQGMITQQTREQQRICDGYGNCYNRYVDRQFTVPAPITVIAGGGVVCFANHGNINQGTRELALYLDDPHTVWPAQRRVAFGWRFPQPAAR